jgi:biopolymer transport protein ExbD
MRLKLKELANLEREKERKDRAIAEKKKLEEIPPIDPTSKVMTPLHLRADGGVKNGEIYELTQLCKEAGFVNVKVRAILGIKEKN